MRCADTVVQVGFEPSVAHHIGLAARHSFVVVVARAAVARNRAVIDYVYAGRAYHFAQSVFEYGAALAYEIGLEGVSHCLVQQYARRSCAHHYRHTAALRTFRLEGHIQVLEHQRGHFGGSRQAFEALAETAAASAADVSALAVGEYGRYGEVVHRPRIPAQLSRGIVHKHVAFAGGEAQVEFAYPGLAAAYEPVRFGHKGNQIAVRAFSPALCPGVEVAVCGRLCRVYCPALPGRHGTHSLPCDGRGGLCCGKHIGGHGAFGVGVAGLFSVQHAYAHSVILVESAPVHAAVCHRELVVGRIFKVEVRVASARGEGRGNQPVQHCPVHLEDVQIISFVLDHLSVSLSNLMTTEDRGSCCGFRRPGPVWSCSSACP